MRYAVARYNQSQRDMVYRIYVTDCLRMITQNTFAPLSGEEAAIVYMPMSYREIIEGKKEEDTRTGDEIAAEVIKSTGIEVIW